MLKCEEVRQEDIKDCGVACISSIIKHYGSYVSFEKLREMTNTTKKGTTAFHIKKAVIELGFNCVVKKADGIKELEKIKHPVILHVIIDDKFYHYIVLYKINSSKQKLLIMDPAKGFKKISFKDLEDIWRGIVIDLYPIKPLPVYNKEKTVMSFFKSIFLKNLRNLLQLLLMSVFLIGINISISYLFKYQIDNYNNLNKKIIYLFILLLIFKTIIEYLKNNKAININYKIDKNLFLSTFSHIIYLPYRFYKTRTTGDIVSRMDDLSIIKDVISGFFVFLFTDIIFVLLILIVIYFVNIYLFLITLMTIFLYIIIIILSGKKFQKHIEENLELKSIINTNLVESINLFETIKGQNLNKEIINDFTIKYEKYIKHRINFEKYYNIIAISKNLLILSNQFLIIFLGLYMINLKVITIGELVMINYLFINIITSVENFSNLEPQLRISYSSIKRILSIYEIDKEQIEEALTLFDSLKIKSLNYSYNDIDNIIYDVNFKIEKKDRVFIFGESGAGKSTIIKLLMKYYHINKNTIYINDQDIDNLNLENIRNNITYISQNEFLKNDSIKNNILLGRNITLQKQKEIYNIIGLNKIIDKYKLDENYLLEENGTNISGGERQRIILGRGLVRDVDICVIDEATSQLDLSSERKILKRIISKYENKTIIFISHRKENKDLFNKIIKIEKRKA